MKNELTHREYVVATFIDIISIYLLWVVTDIILRSTLTAWNRVNVDILVFIYILAVWFRDYIGISLGQRIFKIHYNRPMRLLDVAGKNLITGISLILFFYLDSIFFGMIGIDYIGKVPAEYIYVPYIQTILPFILILLDSYYGWCLRLIKIEIS